MTREQIFDHNIIHTGPRAGINQNDGCVLFFNAFPSSVGMSQKSKGKEKERMAKILKRNESRPRLSVRVLTPYHCIVCFLLLLLLHFIIIIGIFINIYL